jgi:hypothetical protein
MVSSATRERYENATCPTLLSLALSKTIQPDQPPTSQLIPHLVLHNIYTQACPLQPPLPERDGSSTPQITVSHRPSAAWRCLPGEDDRRGEASDPLAILVEHVGQHGVLPLHSLLAYCSFLSVAVLGYEDAYRRDLLG